MDDAARASLGAIPSPPRHPTWRAAARSRWILGVLGLGLALPGLLVAVLFAALGVELLPLTDDILDSEAAVTNDVEVLSIEPTSIHTGSIYWSRVDYRFTGPAGATWNGHSFVADRSEWSVGGPASVEYAPEAPETNRLRGSVRSPGGTVGSIVFGLIFLPGVVLLLLWLRAIMATRVLLTSGRATLARIEGCKPIQGVNPPQLKVRFTFRDSFDAEHQADCWVGAGSPLGRRLLDGVTSVPLIHDEGDPRKRRLAHATDFRDDRAP